VNLHGIVAGAIGAVNPLVEITVRVNLGYVTGPDGTQAPSYGPQTTVVAQIQPLTGGELRHMDSLNLQGDFQAIYINGHIAGLIRPDNKGGDLITLKDGRNYLVSTVLEDWPDWCKVAVTLQNNP
jgi:hypothetical protein